MPSEESNRVLKAMKLARLMGPVIAEAHDNDHETSIADLAAELTRETWLMAAERLGITPPSQKTIGVVLTILREESSEADAFRNLPLRTIVSSAGAGA